MLPAGQDAPTPRRSYYAPHGGHPPQTDIMTDRAVFTEAYAVIPKGVMRDIVTSALPFWEKTRAWIIARPLSGFAETFSQYIMEVQPGGGSARPEPDPEAECVLFVVEGELTLTLAGRTHLMEPGGYAFIPPAAEWSAAERGRGGRALPLDPQGLRGGRGNRRARTLRRQRGRRRADADARARKAAGRRRASSTRPTCATTCM